MPLENIIIGDGLLQEGLNEESPQPDSFQVARYNVDEEVIVAPNDSRRPRTLNLLPTRPAYLISDDLHGRIEMTCDKAVIESLNMVYGLFRLRYNNKNHHKDVMRYINDPLLSLTDTFLRAQENLSILWSRSSIHAPTPFFKSIISCLDRNLGRTKT